MDDSDLPDLVCAIKEGVGSLLFHVHDEEEGIRALPQYVVSAVGEQQQIAIRLGPFVGTIALPHGATIESVPDHTCAHWTWADSSSLLLLQWGFPHLPLLDSLTHWPSGSQHLIVNRRPMALRLEPAEASHVTQVEGYLDDRAILGVNIQASDSRRRDELIAAVATLRLIRNQ